MTRAVRDWDARLGRRLRLRDLHILSNIVQWGSMAKAAKHLAMSQPAVSEAIAQLEDTLGVRLLDRSPRGIRPTIYGDALLRRGLVIFDELKQGIKEIESLADPGTGEVRIGCPEFLADGVVPAFIDQFSRRYPAAFVYVVDALGAREDQQLRERNIDLLLTRFPEPVPELEFHVEILFEERYFVVADARSQWIRRRKVTLADLINERWVLQPARTAIRPLIDSAFRAHGLAVPREKVCTLSMHIRNHLIATGRYLTILPGSALHFNAKRWSVRALPLDLGIKPVPTGIVTLKHRTLSPVVGRFIECARELVKSMAGKLEGRTSRRGNV
jgi:DNA-binding transcriptional LysR family regulator